MVSQEESRTAPPAAGAPLAGEAAARLAGRAAAECRQAVLQKCPYLAGRPPCGTHALFPSGTNVCWAVPGEGKPYRGTSRDTQRAHCLRGPEGPTGCERYRQALAEARPAPRFERRTNAPLGAESAPELDSGELRRRELGQFLHRAWWLLPLCLSAVLLLLALLR